MSLNQQGPGKGDQSTNLCAYCGIRHAETRDHVPPKGFYASPLPSDLITVPSCLACNTDFGKDEEYVRNVLAAGWEVEDDNTPVYKVFNTKVMPSLERRDGALLWRVWESMKEVRVRTTTGDYLGKRPVILLDTPRLESVMKKIGRGLHYHKTHMSLPEDIECQMIFNPVPSELTPAFLEELNQTEIEGNHPEVFRFRCLFAPDRSRGSAWAFQFYGNATFVVFLLIRSDDQSAFHITTGESGQ